MDFEDVDSTPIEEGRKLMSSLESRPPELEDLIKVCRWLNEQSARYIVIGGINMLRLGFVRATEDIDLLVETGVANEAKVIEAIGRLEDHTAREIQPGEIHQHEVIRVADEIVVDLMGKACGVSYQDAKDEIDWQEIEGVRIPFASPELMLRLKQSVREKDALDRQFLIALLGKK